MIVALSKQLTLKTEDLKTINVNHWVATDCIHRLIDEFAVIRFSGWTNRQSRLDGDEPVVKNIRRKIVNTYDENGVIVTNDYNKFIRYESDTTNAKHKEFIKESILEFLTTLPDFTDATQD